MVNKSERAEHDNQSSIRCAIYTRKSTEEGLDQAFNSLDAQREACAAYIVSQRHEGWTLVPDYYDDGGYSGGSMIRPGLQQLMADVASGKVNVIVVYKVDRLTRSLADFAKIVDVLDAAGASFVSITQSFNTTTSMGRLTLNVLLSFAQFEREVISERVRDKIAASKKKGMWMGGPVPLGYDVIDRNLVINEPEAEQVRSIMRLYLDARSVPELVETLASKGLRTKLKNWRDGTQRGGVRYTRGALYHLLSNPIYRGKIVHKEQIYDGQHEAIVNGDLWNEVQDKLRLHGVARRSGTNAKEPSMLTGMVEDDTGRRMKPTHAVKGVRRYRYYVSVDDALAEPRHRGQPARSIASGDLEQAIISGLRAVLSNPATLMGDVELDGEGPTPTMFTSGVQTLRAELDTMTVPRLSELMHAIKMKVRVGQGPIEASYDQAGLAVRLGMLSDLIDLKPANRVALPIPTIVRRRNREIRLVVPTGPDDKITKRDGRLIELLLKAHAAKQQLLSGRDDSTPEPSNYSDRHIARMARIAFLAPDITTSFLEGTQPVGLTARQLLRAPEIPLAWGDQRRMFGYS
jgi:DNA invertase Pin-like site-specific DNA recombinase